MEYPSIFSPLTVKSMIVKNRIAMLPMGSNMGGEFGNITDDHIRYYEQRAKGGGVPGEAGPKAGEEGHRLLASRRTAHQARTAPQNRTSHRDSPDQGRRDAQGHRARGLARHRPRGRPRHGDRAGPAGRPRPPPATGPTAPADPDET